MADETALSKLVPWDELSGKVVLVTGASSGIGREFCLDLAKAGCKIVAAARRVDRLLSLCDEINRAENVGAMAVELDVAAKGPAIEASVKKAWDAFGRIDCLINNAGVRGSVSSPLELSEEEWESTMRTNLTGTWLVSKYVCKHMRDAKIGGSIINISSSVALGRVYQPGALAYSSSKTGVVTLTKVMAMELGMYNIRVNSINPGLFKSEITEGLLKIPGLYTYGRRTIPLKIPGTPGTTDPALTSLVRYLIHDSSEYISGNTFIVDADLQSYDLTYEDEEEDDVKQEIAAQLEFRSPCNRCGEEINWFHRYYYKCDDESCVYSIHKFCAEIPTTLEYPSNITRPLILVQWGVNWWCNICRTRHEPEDLRYCCSSPGSDFSIDVNCAVKRLKTNIIHHPSHMHPLVCMTKRITCECDACGKEHKGIFYHCTTCATLFLHRDCAFLPRKLLIQDAYTDGSFSHTHPLTLAYSFPYDDQRANYFPKCRVCGKSFHGKDNLWMYKCEDCKYYTHLDCATAREEPFMSIFSTPGLGKSIKNFEDADYPDLLHFPLPDQTHSLLKEIFFKQMASSPTPSASNNILQHSSHQHPLILIDHDDTKSCDLLLHNPMKKIELLCNGCLKPITNMPFYKCSTTPNQECHDFVLHEWCTRLPDQVLDHPGHPEHSLLLLPNASHHHMLLGVFKCRVCRLPCNGFVYSCVECDYHIDVNCAFIPDKILHQAHPNHLINWRVQSEQHTKACRSCSTTIWTYNISFSCPSCEFDLHPECALFLPQTIRHVVDKHPMKLSYLPIENHKSLYFCEVCEEKFYPRGWFYHCYECVQSIHSACSPLILDCRRAAPHPAFPRRIYKFLNIKFGGVHNIEDHSHPVSFVQGIESDGDCDSCWLKQTCTTSLMQGFKNDLEASNSKQKLMKLVKNNEKPTSYLY
ncbi:hypothetical protein OSB04_020767 [Centaurea solstitialis]|uniref:DC1 domain-containing protein n=1 Tax=Centaurea solstitialis TaxID=347529 RepID=A0AA38WFK7_9ASTR|nr:hypothetical protein OSB04_020767 [Centaurea solstitialis]